MVRIPVFLLLFVVVASCCGSRELSSAERAKLTPGLLALLTEETVPDELYDVTIRPDGTKEYGIIIRSTEPDDLRAQGIGVQSVIGDVITARVSREQLRSLLSIPSIRSVDQGSKNHLHR
jgi:hypothetical protein